MEKVKHVEFKVAKRIAGFSTTLSFKQCEMQADMDRQILFVESRDKREYAIPFGAINLMEFLKEADMKDHAEVEKAKAEKEAKLKAEKEAVLAQRAQHAQAQKPAGVIKFVKNAKGEIVEE